MHVVFIASLNILSDYLRSAGIDMAYVYLNVSSSNFFYLLNLTVLLQCMTTSALLRFHLNTYCVQVTTKSKGMI